MVLHLPALKGRRGDQRASPPQMGMVAAGVVVAAVVAEVAAVVGEVPPHRGFVKPVSG